MFDINDRLLITLFGLVFFGLGASARLGLWKGWYWRSKGSAYSYIPLSLAFFIFLWREQIDSFFGTDIVFYAVFVLLLAVGTWWSLRPPTFIQPPWVKWVEAHPASVQEAMREEAKKSTEWRSHVESREALDQWAKSLKKTRKVARRG